MLMIPHAVRREAEERSVSRPIRMFGPGCTVAIMTIRLIRDSAFGLVTLALEIELTQMLDPGSKFGHPPTRYRCLNPSLFFWFGVPLGGLIYALSVVGFVTLMVLLGRHRAAQRIGFARLREFGRVVGFAPFPLLDSPVWEEQRCVRG